VKDGSPQIQVISNQVNIENLDIQVGGGSDSWIYNLFASVLHDTIKNAIASAVSDAIKSNTENSLNKILKTIPLKQNITDDMGFDLEFILAPLYNQNSIAVPESGRTYLLKSPEEMCPSLYCPSRILPDVVGNDTKMFTVYVSDYVANSLMYAANKTGDLNYEVEPWQVPSNSPIKLNTSSFSLYVPALQKLWPNTAMSIKTYTSIPPTARFLPTGAIISVTGGAEFWVHPENATKQLAFVLSGQGTVTALAGLSGWKLIPQLGKTNFTFELQKSYVGDFNPQALRNAIQFFISFGILPAINAQLSNGISLPTISGLNFVEPYLIFQKDYLTVLTDVSLSS